KRRMIACISSGVGASTNAKPFDSWVSWLRITLTASATRSSAASHCLMSSAVTQVGRLPRNTVKLIQLILCSGWILRYFKGRIPICHLMLADRLRKLQTVNREFVPIIGCAARQWDSPSKKHAMYRYEEPKSTRDARRMMNEER